MSEEDKDYEQLRIDIMYLAEEIEYQKKEIDSMNKKNDERWTKLVNEGIFEDKQE